jgi:hypothetical protein
MLRATLNSISSLLILAGIMPGQYAEVQDCPGGVCPLPAATAPVSYTMAPQNVVRTYPQVRRVVQPASQVQSYTVYGQTRLSGYTTKTVQVPRYTRTVTRYQPVVEEVPTMVTKYVPVTEEKEVSPYCNCVNCQCDPCNCGAGSSYYSTSYATSQVPYTYTYRTTSPRTYNYRTYYRFGGYTYHTHYGPYTYSSFSQTGDSPVILRRAPIRTFFARIFGRLRARRF